MTTAIKEYKPFRVVYMKDGETIEINETLYKQLQEALKQWFEFIPFWDDTYSKYQIKKICKKKPNDIEQFILEQPKHIRDKIQQHAKDHSINWNTIQHVQNYIDAIKWWETPDSTVTKS